MKLKKKILEPLLGDDISQSIHDALKVCLDDMCDIEFRFNDTKISISYEKLIGSYKSQYIDT